MAPIAIPNELSDRIIDHLHDDVVTLSACSLTCRSWLPTARYHRFSSVTLGRSFDSFSHLVEASPDVRAVVESLAIIGGSWMRPDDIYSPIFNRMLSNLPAVQHIRLESLQFREPKALELPIALKSLTIYNCWFPDGERLSIFLASFTHIGRLSLRRIWAIISRGIAVQDFNPREYPKVTQLCLGYHHARLEIPSILSHPSIGIQSLCCLIEETTSANHCAIALRTFGSTLSHLDILIDSDSNVASLIRNDEDVIDLQHCVALRSCTLRLYTREMCVPENQSLPHVWDLISQIVSSQLEEIVIEIHEDPMEDLQALDSECGFRELLPVRFDDLLAFDWARIHSILEDTRFRSLKRLVLEGRGEYERARKFVQDRYPPLARLLVFRPESSCFVL